MVQILADCLSRLMALHVAAQSIICLRRSIQHRKVSQLHAAAKSRFSGYFQAADRPSTEVFLKAKPKMKMVYMLRTTAIILLGFIAMPASAQSVGHLGQPILRHVNLNLVINRNPSVCSGLPIFRERLPNGEQLFDNFKVPGGQLLVITDVTWAGWLRTTQPFPEGGILTMTLSSSFGSQTIRNIYNASPINLTQDYAGMRLIGSSDSILAGLAVGSGRNLCMQAISYSPSGTLSQTMHSGSIQGYLIKK